jgi:hypothetical protein
LNSFQRIIPFLSLEVVQLALFEIQSAVIEKKMLSALEECAVYLEKVLNALDVHSVL